MSETLLDVSVVDGTLSLAGLRPENFSCHTFSCGQSDSGKTYALGVVLEELLLRTQLPLVIIDPNADFVRLGEVREGGRWLDCGGTVGPRRSRAAPRTSARR